MANPITWRNINAPDLRGVSQMFESGNNSLNAGLNQLTQAAQSVTNERQSVRSQQRNNATQGFLDQINATGSLEDLDALNGSINLDTLDSSQVDTSKIMNALRGQRGTIQDNTTREFAFQNAVEQQRQKPLIEQAKRLGETDPEAARKFVIDNNLSADISEQIETESRSDQEYNKKQSLSQQRKDAMNIVNDMSRNANSAKDIAMGIGETLRSNGITDPDIIRQSEQDAITKFDQLRQRTDEENASLQTIEQSLMRGVNQFDANRDIQRAESFNITPEKEAALNEQESVASVYNYINEKSDKDWWFNNDSTDAQDIVNEVYRETFEKPIPANITTKSRRGNNAKRVAEINERRDNQRELRAAAKTAIGGRFQEEIPAYVIRQAFDRTIKDNDNDWSEATFKQALEKEMKLFYDDIKMLKQKSKFDVETNRLRKEQMDRNTAVLRKAEQTVKQNNLNNIRN